MTLSLGTWQGNWPYANRSIPWWNWVCWVESYVSCPQIWTCSKAFHSEYIIAHLGVSVLFFYPGGYMWFLLTNESKHIYFKHIGFNKTRYGLIHYRANLGDWNKESIEYKHLYFGESAFWMLERWTETWTWQKRYVNNNPWL